jgi:hypothetical protein
MSAQHELAGILQQWLQLTREESAAIQSARWPALTRIQARKAALREALPAAARRSAQEDAAAGPARKSFRAEVGRITSLLTRNSETLAAQLRQVRARQELLDQAKRNLRKIQRSYLRPRHPAAWNSYS